MRNKCVIVQEFWFSNHVDDLHAYDSTTYGQKKHKIIIRVSSVWQFIDVVKVDLL